MPQENFSMFVQRWAEFLNKDEELWRRLKGFKTFSGGPCPYPGPGPYPPPTLAYDPTDWGKSKGYPASILDGKELIELSIASCFTYRIELKEGKFYIMEGKAEEPCLGVEMPLSLFKEMVLSKHRVIWALADERNKVTYMPGISLSDWTTIFEVLVTAQELVDMDPEMRKIIKDL